MAHVKRIFGESGLFATFQVLLLMTYEEMYFIECDAQREYFET